MDPLFTSEDLSSAASRSAALEAASGELPVAGRTGSQVARSSLQRILTTERRLRIGVGVSNVIALLAAGGIILRVARAPLSNLPKDELERFGDRLSTVVAIFSVAAAASIAMSIWSHIAERELRQIARAKNDGERIRVTP